MCLEVPKVAAVPRHTDAGFLIDVYDWDRMVLGPAAETSISSRLVLCAGPLPCALLLLGESSEGSSVKLSGGGALACLNSFGCSLLSLSNVELDCVVEGLPAMYSPVEISGSLLRLVNTTMKGCWSQEDGGGVKAYAGAIVQVSLFLLNLKSLHTSVNYCCQRL